MMTFLVTSSMIILTIIHHVSAWTLLPTASILQQSPHQRHRKGFIIYASTEDNGIASAINNVSTTESETSQEETADVNKPEIEWGVSYIGGDPCGSKYNDDPFDKKPGKPGLPDDMKKRIEALAEKKRLENE